MTTHEIERGFQEIRELFKETDQEIKETARQIKQTDRKVDALTSKWGRFVEGLIAPGVQRLFQERGIEVEKVYQRVKAHRAGREREVDLLAIDEGYAVLIEAKSTLSIEDINEHLERLEQFKKLFPEYKKKKAVGAVAGIVFDEGADRFAYRKGLFVIAQSGDAVKILNDKKFKPKTW